MDKRIERIVDWIEVAEDAGKETLVVGVSGGVETVRWTSTQCCMTGLDGLCGDDASGGRGDGHKKATQHSGMVGVIRFPGEGASR